jgi:hypothetical protein
VLNAEKTTSSKPTKDILIGHEGVLTPRKKTRIDREAGQGVSLWPESARHTVQEAVPRLGQMGSMPRVATWSRIDEDKD